MKILILYIGLTCCLSASMKAQITFSLDTIYVSFVVDTVPSPDVNERFGQGPALECIFSIKNMSDSSYVFENNLDEVCVLFNYKGRTYKEFFTLYNIKGNVLPPKGEVIINTMENYIFNLNLRSDKPKGGDYSKELIQVLPTLQVVLNLNGRDFITSGAKQVLIRNYDYYEYKKLENAF